MVKKYFEPSCGCCSFENKKEDYFKRLDMKDANEYYLDLYFDSEEKADMQELDIEEITKEIRKGTLRCHNSLLEVVYEILEGDPSVCEKFTTAMSDLVSPRNQSMFNGATESISTIVSNAIDKRSRRIAECSSDGETEDYGNYNEDDLYD